MPNRKSNVSVTLVRDGKRIEVAVGQVFDFTDDEIKQITASNADALSTTANVDLEAEDVVVKSETKAPAKSKKAADAGPPAGGDL